MLVSRGRVSKWVLRKCEEIPMPCMLFVGPILPASQCDQRWLDEGELVKVLYGFVSISLSHVEAGVMECVGSGQCIKNAFHPVI